MSNVGIIDLGSNTIRLSIYDVVDGHFNLVINRKEMAGLAGYIEDGHMSQDGIDKAISVLLRNKNILNGFNIDEYYVLATAPLRNIDNRDNCIYQIESMTGMKIDAITGEQEAQYDFQGSLLLNLVSSGLLIDIGGGSTELVYFKDGQIIDAVSMPIGSLSLYTQHCNGVVPSEKEYKAMKKHVKKCLKDVPFAGEVKCANVVGVGGTIRACNKLYKKVNHLKNNTVLSSKNIMDLSQGLVSTDLATVRLVLKTVPERIHTITPGVIILKEVLKAFEGELLYISSYGVREGYLNSKIIENK